MSTGKQEQSFEQEGWLQAPLPIMILPSLGAVAGIDAAAGGLFLSGIDYWLRIALAVVGGLASLLFIIIVTSRYRKNIYAFLLDLWLRFMLDRPLAPSFGLVTERLSALDLEGAVPAEYPPHNLRFGGYGEITGPTPQLERAASWAAVIHAALLAEPTVIEASLGVHPIVTTVGFVRFRDADIKLAVIHYVQPTALIRMIPGSRPTLSVAGETFPQVVRPWLPKLHKGRIGGDGHCWVTFGDSPPHRGVVSARHVLEPVNAALNDKVALKTLRSAIRGTLRHSSQTMDVALVEVDENEVPELIPAPYSRVIGYKPVRFLTGSHRYPQPIEADITGLPGFTGKIYTKKPGGEPLLAAIMTMNRHAMPGDSGCLVLDIEYEAELRARPYLIYQGRASLGRDDEGYGLYLGQVADQWKVSTHVSKREL
jgi:hypothetical protein